MRLTVTDHRRDRAGLRYVYPVASRRAGGVSIGINLNPNNACNWRCIYCQVPDLKRGSAPPIDLERLEAELRGFIDTVEHDPTLVAGAPEGMRRVVDFAISGNGEPTTAAELLEAVELLGRLRREITRVRGVELRLITNGSLIHRPAVARAVKRLGDLGGEVWFKVDAGTASGFRRVNGVRMTPQAVARRLTTCAGLCRTWVQTCVFRLDGASPEPAEIDAYLALLREAGVERLQGVLLYGMARPSLQPEAPRLSGLAVEALESIAARIRNAGLTVRVSP